MQYKTLILTGLIGIGILIIGIGCEYDAPSSVYNPDSAGDKPEAVISQIVPEQEAGGGNEIVIHGENFASELSDNAVYFNNVQAELVSGDTTQLVVLRPNLVEDSITIKVVVPGALNITEYSPYNILPVMKNFTKDFDGIKNVSGFAIGSEGNFYYYMGNDRTLHKQDAGSTEKEAILDVSQRSVGRLRFGPGGDLFYTKKNILYVISFEEKIDSIYALLPERTEFFDFDENGYAYFVGDELSMYIMKSPDEITTGDDYSEFECLALRIYNNAVYVLAEYTGDDEAIPVMAVWKNEIIENGVEVSEKELYVNWTDTEYGEATPVDIEFGADGALYISSDYEQPIIKVKDGLIYPLYINMLPSPVTLLDWGPDQYLYFYYDADDADERHIYQLDMGEMGAPHYGR